MFKGWWSRMKDAVGITPKPERNYVDEWLDGMEERFYQQTPPEDVSQESMKNFIEQEIAQDVESIANQVWADTSKTRPMTTQQRIELANRVSELLKPRLVVDNTVKPKKEEVLYRKVGNDFVAVQPPQPALTLYPNHRVLNQAWVDYNKYWYGYSDEKAYYVGANLMMDNEFGEKMRGNVEILPFDPAQPLNVRIKYHDPGKESL